MNSTVKEKPDKNQMKSVLKPFINPQMTTKQFDRLSTFIHEHSSIKLPPIKKVMLTARLNKRIRALGYVSFDEYLEFLFSEQGKSTEITPMIDCVTTNKTEFFREDEHFKCLSNKVLPAIMEQRKKESFKNLKVWSAGCSSGEEPYTIAMVLSEFFKKGIKGDFSIVGSDLSTRILETAQNAIYSEDKISSIPEDYLKKYLLKGINAQSGLYRVAPQLRNRVSFMHQNLLKGNGFNLDTKMDIIFCRNVIIYFNRETQRKLFRKFFNQLKPGGFLFIGHSETLHGINDQFRQFEVTVYQKPF